ncbi:MAG: chloride channel protein [Candidatus Latescibacterota bacterium]
MASNLGRLLKFKTIPLQYVVISGISAAFGSIFKAPMAGVVFGCEILYLRDMEYRPLIICIFSSLSSYLTYTAIFRTRVLFAIPGSLLNYSFQPSHVSYFLLFGFFVGISASLYILVLRFVEMRFALFRAPLYLKTALGGLLTGMVGLGVSQVAGAEISVLGMGIHDVIRMFSHVRMLSVYVLGVLLIGKVVATAFTIGSGASGGLVMPTFFVGAALGGLMGHVFGGDALLFAIVGCLAFFASAAHAPLAMTFFAAETFNLNYILPVAISAFIGSWVAGSVSLYAAVAAQGQDVAEGEGSQL